MTNYNPAEAVESLTVMMDSMEQKYLGDLHISNTSALLFLSCLVSDMENVTINQRASYPSTKATISLQESLPASGLFYFLIVIASNTSFGLELQLEDSESFTRRFLYQGRERQVGRRMVMTAEETNTSNLHEYYVSFRSTLHFQSDLDNNI